MPTAIQLTMARVEREPRDRGWIGIHNAWGCLAYIDCREGGAQKLLTELRRGFERAGWQLERGDCDGQFIKKATIRWEIRIGVAAPASADRGM